MGLPESKKPAPQEFQNSDSSRPIEELSPEEFQNYTSGQITSNVNNIAVIAYKNGHITLNAIGHDEEKRQSFLRLYGETEDGTVDNTDVLLDNGLVVFGKAKTSIILPEMSDEGLATSFSWVEFETTGHNARKGKNDMTTSVSHYQATEKRIPFDPELVVAAASRVQ